MKKLFFHIISSSSSSKINHLSCILNVESVWSVITVDLKYCLSTWPLSFQTLCTNIEDTCTRFYYVSIQLQSTFTAAFLSANLLTLTFRMWLQFVSVTSILSDLNLSFFHISRSVREFGDDGMVYGRLFYHEFVGEARLRRPVPYAGWSHQTMGARAILPIALTPYYNGGYGSSNCLHPLFSTDLCRPPNSSD